MNLDHAIVPLIISAVVVPIFLLLRGIASSYNRCRELHELVLKSRSNISIAIDRRSTAINDLAQIARSFGNLEQVNLLQLSKDRSNMSMSASYQMAGSLLHQVHVAAEQFPVLQSSHQYQMLCQSIEHLERDIQWYRNESNERTTEYNSRSGKFPFALISRALGLHREDYVQLDVDRARVEASPLELDQRNSERFDYVIGHPRSDALPLPGSNEVPVIARGHAPLAALPPAHQPSNTPRAREAHEDAPERYGSSPTPSGHERTVVASSTSSAIIRFTSGPRHGEAVQVGPSTTIGRNASNANLVIPHPQVSSIHAWIGWNGHALVFIDQGSTNGSLINGTPVHPHEEVPLRAGDVITLGQEDTVSLVLE